MPKKTVKQMRLFTTSAGRKRKPRRKDSSGTKAAARVLAGSATEPDAEPVQLDLIAHLEQQDRSG